MKTTDLRGVRSNVLESLRIHFRERVEEIRISKIEAAGDTYVKRSASHKVLTGRVYDEGVSELTDAVDAFLRDLANNITQALAGEEDE